MGATAPITTDWFWTEVELLRERWDVLEHPFYRRWSAGELRSSELQLYASEYHHAVLAIAVASKRAAELAHHPLVEKLRDHAIEERDHVDAWARFARATGWCRGVAWFFGEDPYEQTVACARVWSGGQFRRLPEHLVTLYAIESAQPSLSRVKLEGLLEHYGFEEGPGTEYFSVHAWRDHGHAALAREAFEQVAFQEDPFALLGQVEAVYRSHWGLLDGLEQASRG